MRNPVPSASPRRRLLCAAAGAALSAGEDRITLVMAEQAIDRALAIAEGDDAVLITGSLYIVGGARPYLHKVL